MNILYNLKEQNESLCNARLGSPKSDYVTIADDFTAYHKKLKSNLWVTYLYFVQLMKIAKIEPI